MSEEDFLSEAEDLDFPTSGSEVSAPPLLLPPEAHGAPAGPLEQCCRAALAGAAQAEEAPSLPPPSKVTVRSLPGTVIASFEPLGPMGLKALKEAIEEKTGVRPVFQRLVRPGQLAPIAEGEDLPSGEPLEVTLIVDETPLYTWDLANNPSKGVLQLEDNRLSCRGLRTDFVNVLAQEPLRTGVHYVRFLMHRIGDEQWCGLLSDDRVAGPRTSGRSLRGFSYYCGRMSRRSSTNLRDGHGALHAQGRAVVAFKSLQSSGDAIGMLADRERGVLVFDHNGEVQGALPLPPSGVPLWISTHLDTPTDSVELQKLSAADAPEAVLEAAQGPTLDLTKGERVGYFEEELSSNEDFSEDFDEVFDDSDTGSEGS